MKRNGHGVPIDMPGDDVCTTCGRVDCEAKKFLDTKPMWVGSDGEYFEPLSYECEKAAKDLGERFADLWRVARVLVRSMDLHSGENDAVHELAEIVGRDEVG